MKKKMLFQLFPVLIMLFLAVGCGKIDTQRVENDPLLAIPSGARMAVIIDIANSRHFKIFQEGINDIQKDAQSTQKLKDFETKTKINIFKDVDSISMAVYQPGSASSEGVAVFKGNFDKARVIKAIKDEKGLEFKYKKLKYYVTTDKDKLHIAIPSNKLIILSGDENTLKKSLDLLLTPKDINNIRADKELIEHLSSLNQKAIFRVVSEIPSNVKEQMSKNPALKPFEVINTIRAFIDISDAYNINADLIAKDPAATEIVKTELLKNIELIKTIAKGVGQDKGAVVSDLLQKIVINSKNNVLNIVLKISSEEFTQFRQTMAQK